MAFEKKTWQFNDIITEGELNRMEDGIEEGIAKAEQAEQIAQQSEQTANQTASDLASHLAEDVTREDVIQTTEVNDSMKVPSSAVTYGINQKFEGLSFLSLIAPSRVKKIIAVTDVADLDNCKNTGVYTQEIPGNYASVLTFNISSLLDRDNVIQIRAYSFVSKVEIRHYYHDDWTDWVTLIP